MCLTIATSKEVSIAQGPHSQILVTAGPSDSFGSEILAKSDFFWVYERRWDFLGLQKQTEGFSWVAKKELRDFFGYDKKVVIFFGRQILKL